MPTLTPQERLLRGAMIKAASTERTPLSYMELGDAVRGRYRAEYPMISPPFRGLGEALGHISLYEHSLGRPLLSAIVVTQATSLPGEGFVPFAHRLGRDVGSDPAVFCRAEMNAVWDFWSDPDPTRVADAAFLRVLDVLQALRRDLTR